MSTDLSRTEAKGAIVDRDISDPELDHVMSSAHLFQLGITKEQNRHTEQMRGVFSRVFGQGDNAQTYIAAFAMVSGLIITVGCYVTILFHKEDVDFWSKQAERAFSFSSTCLAFIFGKGLSRAVAALLDSRVIADGQQV